MGGGPGTATKSAEVESNYYDILLIEKTHSLDVRRYRGRSMVEAAGVEDVVDFVVSIRSPHRGPLVDTM